METGGVQQFSDGEVYFWIEQESSIMLKAITGFGDPVELTAHDVRELAEALLQAADALDPP